MSGMTEVTKSCCDRLSAIRLCARVGRGRFACVMVALVSGMLVSGILYGTDSIAAEKVEYNRDVRPILADNCFACHGADSAARKADLRIDQRDGAIDMGAIVPGDADESELIRRVLTDDPDQLMPPAETKKHLTDDQKQTLQRWIAEGAEYQPHWSFIAPRKSTPPAVANESWIKNEVDRFVLARLEANGLSPAPEAPPHVLFRRLHLDTTGLPPGPEDTRQFIRDYQANGDAAMSDWIERLMARPEWGEHRARYWLDAARYGDTHGLHFDNYREMWPYRDWVIRAFNSNQPYDRFLVEQLAGDLLASPSNEQLIATGFQRCNITTNEGGTIDDENLANYAVDRVQTFGWVVLGLTTNCAQCHDHKFDPLTMKDFYSLAAFFRNTTQGPKDGNVKDGLGPVLVLPGEADRGRWDALPDEIAEAIRVRNARRRVARDAFNQWASTTLPESLTSTLPSQDLILRLALNEGTGNVCQAQVGDSSESKTFTASGDIQWIADGKYGSAPTIAAGRTFDLGSIGDLERDHSFSYGAWVKTANQGTSAAILAHMDESAGFRGWDLWQNGNSFAVHLIDSWPDNSIKVTTKGSLVTPGKWQHVFATYDGSGLPGGVKIYVDGKQRELNVDNGTLKPDASFRTPTPLRIGQRSGGAVLEGGSVQDVRVFGRTLAADEVRLLAEHPNLVSLLATPVDKRTKEQEDAAFNFYLDTQDEQHAELARKARELEAEKGAIRSRSAVTHIQQEKKDAAPMTFMLMRGEYDRPGEQVAAAPPAALHPLPDAASSDRLGLATWSVDSRNPLTARVTVNRFWQQVFGAGIVTTTEDFGVMGALPTHPELLDTLAIEFQEQGWDVRWLFKTMLMSASYRQSSVVTPEKLERDRDNGLLSRGPRFRMDAEMLRDSSLAASGLLSRKMYGPSVKPYQPVDIWEIVGLPGGDTREYQQSSGEDLYRRSLYTFWKRMAPPPNLEAFNAPSREVCTVRRERTNTPLQALVTLNDPQFVEAARCLAAMAISESADDPSATASWIAMQVLARALTEKERRVVTNDHLAFLDYYQSNLDDAKSLIATGESKIGEGLDPASLAAWTLVCNQIMNLDEALNK